MRPTVAILMGTYNGEKYLKQQLDSIEVQTLENWRLIVSDDGSTDGTLKLLEEYRARWGAERMEIRQGPRQGFCQNFMSLACAKEIDAEFFAFSDQDDVWLKDKLEVAVSKMNKSPGIDQPFLYCGRTAYVKDDLQPYENSPLFVYPKTFRNALVQSIAGGNTMVFNKAVKSLLEKANVRNPVSHDWWVYQLVTGAGGIVFYDPTPFVLYRQHEDALVGGNTSALAKVKRFILVVNGRFRQWNDVNIAAMNSARHCLSRGALEILDLFVLLRNSNSLAHRLRMLEVCGLYRQTWRDTVVLILAAALKKL